MAKKTTKKKAKSNGSTPKASKPRQTVIVGTERKVHKDVRAAAEAYVEVRDERQELTLREVEAKGTLMGLMKKHELTTYIDEDAEIEVEIVPVDETVKVRHYDPEKAAKKAARKAEEKAAESGRGEDESFATPQHETTNGASNGAAEASAP